jgi:hypothetical protein
LLPELGLEAIQRFHGDACPSGVVTPPNAAVDWLLVLSAHRNLQISVTSDLASRFNRINQLLPQLFRQCRMVALKNASTLEAFEALMVIRTGLELDVL